MGIFEVDESIGPCKKPFLQKIASIDIEYLFVILLWLFNLGYNYFVLKALIGDWEVALSFISIYFHLHSNIIYKNRRNDFDL